MTFVLETFGKLRLAGGNGSVIALPGKGLLLLAYLLSLDEGSAHSGCPLFVGRDG